MVSTWMDDHSSVEVDAVVKNTAKSQEWRNGAPEEKCVYIYIHYTVGAVKRHLFCGSVIFYTLIFYNFLFYTFIFYTFIFYTVHFL